MKIKKPSVNVIIIICIGFLLVGCKSNNVSLDFLIIPEQLRIHSNSQLKELNEIESKLMANNQSMNEKYDDILNMSEEDLKIQEELVKQFMDRLDSGIIIKDKNMIENIFKQLRTLEGVYTDSFEGGIIAKIELIEDPETESLVSLDNSYLREFILLGDGNMVIPKGIMVKSTRGLEPTGKIEYIKVCNKDNFRGYKLMMQNIDLINGYEISQLSIQDNSAVEELCHKCSDYYMLSGGKSPSKDDANALFTALPPKKNPKDKFLL